MRCDQCIDKVDAKDEECVVEIEVRCKNGNRQCVEVNVVGERGKHQRSDEVKAVGDEVENEKGGNAVVDSNVEDVVLALLLSHCSIPASRPLSSCGAVGQQVQQAALVGIAPRHPRGDPAMCAAC